MDDGLRLLKEENQKDDMYRQKYKNYWNLTPSNIAN